MVNTIIKSKKLKSIIDNIKQEQLDNKLTNIEKLEKAKETYISIIANKLKEQKELEGRIKALEEKNESQEITLLKEIHQRELKKLEDTIELRKLTYEFALEIASDPSKKIKGLEKELEEKEILVDYLQTRFKKEEKAECHL